MAEIRPELRTLTWDDCGIMRSGSRLEEADTRVRAARGRSRGRGLPAYEEADGATRLCPGAALMVEGARRRQESRGLHFDTDHPHNDQRFRAATVPARLPQ